MGDDLVHRGTAEKGKGCDGGRLAVESDGLLTNGFNTRNLQKDAHWLSTREGQQLGTRRDPVGVADP